MRRFPFRAPFLLLGCLLALLPAAAGAHPNLSISDGDTPLAQLRIGDHLVVTLRDLAPFTTYQVALYDDLDHEIVRLAAATDCAGASAASLLWAHTGIVGCDPCAWADPAAYRFGTFGEAAGALDGRIFTVAVFDPAGNLVAWADLPLVTTAEERPYVADGDGCPRQRFVAGEQVFLAFYQPAAGGPGERTVFLVPATAAGLPLGAELTDVRGAAQGIDLRNVVRTPVQHLWTPPVSLAGDFTVVVRTGLGLEESYSLGGDVVLGGRDPRSKPGISITVGTMSCPPRPTP